MKPEIHCAGLTLIVVGVVVALAAAAAVAAILLSGGQGSITTDQMRPASIEDLNITTVKEGQTILEVFGKNRIAGNLIWYGNLKTEAIKDKVRGGGKGGGGKKTTETVRGYKYYLDAWMGMCIGKIEILNTYQNDKLGAPEVVDTIFNDGTNSSFPTEPGQNANALKGVAHIFYKKWSLGENKTFVPSVSWEVRRILPTTGDYANLYSNHPNDGNNPAAIIYYLLTTYGEVPSSEINLPSFENAAAYWNGRDYALNIVFRSQQDLAQMIRQVLSYVDGLLYQNREGLWTLNPFDPSATATKSLTEIDFLTFKISRKSYVDTNNDFSSSFKDKDLDYTNRVAKVFNQASIKFVGRRPQSIDLSAFNDRDIVSKRLFEIAKRSSYPPLLVEFKTTLKYSDLEMGDIISISHVDFNMTNMPFRIIGIDDADIKRNEIGFRAIQQIEALFDDVYESAGGSEGSGVVVTTDPFVNMRVFELPFSRTWGHNPAFVLLVARLSEEIGYELLFSTNGVDYISYGVFDGFSQHGTLDVDYPANTFPIDDADGVSGPGITYTPTRDDPVFETITRQELFTTTRVAIMDDEMVIFERVIPVGGNSYRLEGIRRGLLHTPIQTHTAGSTIWLTTLDTSNILSGVNVTNFWVKFVPIGVDASGDPSAATPVAVTVSWKGKTPWKPGYIKVTRTGNNADILIYPCDQDNPGAGSEPPKSYGSVPPPFPHSGDFEVKFGLTTEYTTSTNYSTTIPAGPVTMTIAQRVNGKVGPARTVEIGATDGVYYGSDNF